MVYAVFCGCYSDWEVKGYFTNKEDAEKYCAIKNSKLNEEDYNFDELYVVPLSEINTEEVDLNVKLKYHHEIVFDFETSRHIGMRNEPERYAYYVGKKKETTFKCNPMMWFSVSVTADSREKAEKIAQDYYAQFLYYKEEFGVNEACKLMNATII